MDIDQRPTSTPIPPYTPPPEEPGRPVVMGHLIPEPQQEGWRSIVSTVIVILLAPLVALFLTMFVFQSYQVDGASMEPTLKGEDRLLVWKLPRTIARLTGNHYVPARGDIVIFVEPKIANYGQAPDKQLIKRVMAFAGERVVVKDGTLTVYNKEHPDGFRPDDLMSYGKTIPPTNYDTDVVVQEGHIFVAGDNRPESLDSRYFDPVSLDNIIGKLSYRVLPIDKVAGF